MDGDGDGDYARGMLCAKARDWIAAQRHFEKCLQREAGHFQALNALGNLARLREQWDDAKHLYALALERRPDFAPALSNLGWCLAKEGDPDAGLPYLERAFELQPCDAGVVLNYAEWSARHRPHSRW